jgi:tRNA uridine 5-carboxymethylaminomethyl modification enzyme
VQELESGEETLRSIVLSPTEWNARGVQVRLDGVARSAFEILTHNNMTLDRLLSIFPTAQDDPRKIGARLDAIPPSIRPSLQIAAQYAPDLQRQNEEILRVRKQAGQLIDPAMAWKDIAALSAEEKEKLTNAKPTTVGALWKIPGITPSAVMAICTHIRKGGQTRRLSEEEYRAQREEKIKRKSQM